MTTDHRRINKYQIDPSGPWPKDFNDKEELSGWATFTLETWSPKHTKPLLASERDGKLYLYFDESPAIGRKRVVRSFCVFGTRGSLHRVPGAVHMASISVGIYSFHIYEEACNDN